MSFSQEDIRFIRSRVEETLGRPVPENVTVKEGEGLTVTSGPEGAVIAAESRAALARGLTHLAKPFTAPRRPRSPQPLPPEPPHTTAPPFPRRPPRWRPSP